jgi:manganese/zinc/iron transport system permease protein
MSNSLSEFLRILCFNSGYNTNIVLIGTICLGIGASIVGTFTVLRKRALIGDALAHSTLPGLCSAFFVGPVLGINQRSLPLLLLGATCSGVLGMLSVQAISKYTRLTQDAAIGIVLSVFFGAGTVGLSIVQQSQTGNEGGLQNFIFGQAASMTASDATLVACVAVLSIIITFLFLKEFRCVCFDSDYTLSLGWSVTLIDSIMLFLLVLVTVIGLQVVGLLMIVALLIIPPAGARFWTDNLLKLTFISGSIGGISAYIGASTSALIPNMPTGAVIVICASFIFFFSLMFSPKRGIIAKSWTKN